MLIMAAAVLGAIGYLAYQNFQLRRSLDETENSPPPSETLTVCEKPAESGGNNHKILSIDTASRTITFEDEATRSYCDNVIVKDARNGQNLTIENITAGAIVNFKMTEDMYIRELEITRVEPVGTDTNTQPSPRIYE